MTRKRIIIISMVSLLLLGGLAACKHRYHHRGLDQFDIEAMVNRVADKLDLTESQQADLTAIAAELVADAKAMRADRRAHHAQVAAMVRSEQIDRTQVDAMVQAKREKISALIDKATDRLVTFHATLTPEQREILAKHIETRAERGGCFAH